MPKQITSLLLLCAIPFMACGCGNPCQGVFTDGEVDFLVGALERDKGNGLSRDDAILDGAAGCSGNFECRECASWIIDIVY